MKRIFIAALLIIGIGAAAQERQHVADAAQGEKHAVTEFSVNYLRTAPDYESALETQELMGTVVEVVGQKGYWRQVTTPQPYTAWCTDLGLAYKSEEEIAEYIAAPKYIFTALYGHVFSRPSLGSEPVCDLVAGDLLRIVFRGSKGKTGQADRQGEKASGHRKAPVRGKWAEVMLPSGKTGFVPRKEVQEFREWAGAREATVENIIRTAKQFTGVPYLWGGMSSKGLDCSGLTRLTWLLNGVLLPRNASQQVHTGDDVPVNPDPSFGAGSVGLKEEMLRRVRNLRPGDLVFFGTPAAKPCNVSGMSGTGNASRAGGTAKDRITHVGIYIGGNRIIHSSHTVRINSLIPGDEDYYENAHRLIRARRIIGQEDCGKGIVSIINSPAYF